MEYLRYIREYGLILFVTKVIRHISFSSKSKLSWMINNINHNIIQKKLNRIFENQHIEIAESPQKSLGNSNIWIMWWQGEENAPDIVKCCINSIRKNSYGHNVVIISEKNYREYVKFPEYIYRLFELNKISRTHLSDMIRLYLLYSYGGLWIDATVFVSRRIPEYIYEKNFFSCNFGTVTKDPSRGRWTTFVMASKKGNDFIRKILEYYLIFWREHDILIDYILFDYIIEYVINQNEDYLKMISDIPVNNTKVFEMVEHLDNVLDESIAMDDMSDTYFHKLSYKRKYLKRKDGKKTLYSYILEEYLYEVR